MRVTVNWFAILHYIKPIPSSIVDLVPTVVLPGFVSLINPCLKIGAYKIILVYQGIV